MINNLIYQDEVNIFFLLCLPSCYFLAQLLNLPSFLFMYIANRCLEGPPTISALINAATAAGIFLVGWLLPLFIVLIAIWDSFYRYNEQLL